MNRYDNYKDSGVAWIGKIPCHWEVVRFKYLFSYMQAGSNLTSLYINPTDTYPVYGGNGLRGYYNRYNWNGKCILIGRQGALCGNIHLADGKLWATDHAVIAKARENNHDDFLFFLATAMNLNQYASQTAAQPGLSVGIIKQVKTVRPPHEEQTVIADYLKDKTSKIEQYVAERAREREQLESLKQSEIANVVTKGLNPNVPMKDSGIPWIGMIPEHWEVKKLRHFLKFVSVKGHGDKMLLSVTREQGVILRNIESKDENHNFIPDDLNGYKLVKPGQFVINKMKSWQGSYGVSDFEGIVSPAYYVCNLEFSCKEYFSMAIRCKAYIPFFTQYSKGIRVDQWDLSPIGLKNIPFVVPPPSEQQAIVSYIEDKLQKIDTCIADLQAEINYLKEFKQRLISDVVTGQICVTNLQKGELK